MAKQLQLRDDNNIEKIQKRRLYSIILLNLKILLKTSKGVKNQRKISNIPPLRLFLPSILQELKKI